MMGKTGVSPILNGYRHSNSTVMGNGHRRSGPGREVMIMKKITGRRVSGRLIAAVMAGALVMAGPAGAQETGMTEDGWEEILPEIVTETTTESAQILAEESLSETGETGEESEEVVTKGLTFAKDYREVFEALLAAQRYDYPYVLDGDVLDYAVEETADMSSNAAATGTASAKAVAADSGAPDYSTTNLRDENVDEADIVRTDGEYIYILQDSRELAIVKADGADSAYVSITDILGEDAASYDTTMEAREMFVDGDSLVIILGRSDRRDDEQNWYYSWKDSTVTSTWDISDPSAPAYRGSVTQDGTYKEARKRGDIVYTYSTQYVNVYMDTYENSKDKIIPYVNGEKIEPGRICIPDYCTNSAYLIVTSLSTQAPDTVIDSKAMVSGAESIYVTLQSLYVMNQSYNSSQGRTEIIKFSLQDGKITGRAAARVKGTVNDTFSIDEYDGNLRVLTTYMGSDTGALLEALSDLFGLGYYADDHWVRHNALYVLDENLQRRARLGDIAENEEIRSARYFGDTVYFVTFRNTDPLFTADLSDPDHPKLTGELKVSGFSSYLHPYGDGRLLGIGYEADEMSGSVTGIKLSMFDVSDPANVQEIDRFVIEGVTWCPAIEDYRAILANGKKNLTGFYCDNRYMAFRFDETSGFERVLLYDFYEDMLTGKADHQTMRGLYIGDEMYLAGNGFVVGFDMAAESGFEKNLVLKQ